MGIYSELKSRVTTREIAEHYGFKVNRNGMTKCPFHDDRTPSMKVDRNFICFGCQEKGDAVRFASLLFGLPPYEAARKVINDMGLNVTIENSPIARTGINSKPDAIRTDGTQKNDVADTCRDAAYSLEDNPLFRQTVDRLYDIFCRYLRLLNRWAVEFAPHSPDEDLHPLFVEAMHQTSYVEYLLDLLFNGSEEDKISVIIEKGKKVDKLERRIHEYESV